MLAVASLCSAQSRFAQRLLKRTRLRAGIGHTNESAARARTDPCAALNGWWKKTVICQSFRDYKHITEIYLMGSISGGDVDVRGTLPATIGALSHLQALSIVGSGVRGTIPPSLGEVASLNMVWFDHNPHLGGSLPLSLAQLNLSVLELHYSNFSGALPPLDYLAIPDCMLYNDRWSATRQRGASMGNNVFTCPLPHGADSCGAVCA